MKIYNTLTKRKEEFVPLEPGVVKMYVCGPTVYNYFHIGNGRTFSFFDVVRRYFEYSGYKVIFVQNITDVDDKLIAQSIKENIPMPKLAEKYKKAFFADIAKLEMKKADHYPIATEFIGEMIRLIKQLEDNGFAYEKNGDVYFSVNSYKNYGQLSRKKIDELQAGARVEENFQKRDPADFTLWKKAKVGEPKWESPWGAGRPGWHTECVVMSRKILGETFDIHGGAIDLIFPHHENELAQARVSSDQDFVKYWMHGGFLNISGEKMSKSLDNFFLTRDVLNKFKPETIRFFFLSKHYRSSIDYNEDIIKESENAMKTLYSALEAIDYLSFMDEEPDYSEIQNSLKNKFIDSMDDDFNSAKAIAVLFELVKIIKNPDEILAQKKQSAHLLTELGKVLGFFRSLEVKLTSNLDHLSEELIELLLKYRISLKKDKNWELADSIRTDLNKLGIEIKDTSDGSIWNYIK
ncbi:MAG: cysteine--tRNA ligase [Candidatus Cloacimonetes bacterium]|nr:cysteine--tRNA ligase [Candidatus Cloacimonadota bacterium]